MPRKSEAIKAPPGSGPTNGPLVDKPWPQAIEAIQGQILDGEDRKVRETALRLLVKIAIQQGRVEGRREVQCQVMEVIAQ